MEPSPYVGGCWFIVIAFMFFCQHHVCDAYFVPAINVFVEKMRKSKTKCLNRWGEEAVAGATICALGCNGPELFTNLIALYTGSDAGIGVVVGSEIFNLLIIVGCTVLATPALPLQIEKVPFARDVTAYFISILLLAWTLQDMMVQWYEAYILLFAAACYVAIVYFTTDFINCIPALRALQPPAGPVVAAGDKPKGRMHGIEVEVQEVVHSRMADGRGAGQSANWSLDATAHGIYASTTEPAAGKNTGSRGSIGFQFQNPDSMLGAVLKYKDLTEVVVMDMGTINLEFNHKLKHVTLKVTCQDSESRDALLASIEQYSLKRPWIHGYDATVVGAWNHLTHAFKDGSCLHKILAIPEFIVDFALKLTLFAVDVKDTRKQDRWPLCFMGAMFWLAIFSWCMLEVAEQIHYNLPVLPNAFLGITVCAIGTSFPNAVASVLMAQQNKPAAAIANALGSNVQNVFLAMALPWVIYSVQTGGAPIPQNVAGINEGVYWMMGTLILVLFFVVVPPVCALTKPSGIFLIFVYVFYLVLTSGETFGWWPPLVK
jgi:Ca2+/Na+ antiporter